MTLLELARRICQNPELLTTPFETCADAVSLVECTYEPSVWQRDFRNDISEIRAKNIEQLTRHEIFAYLTFIACTERTQNGCYDRHIKDGTVLKLLRRYTGLQEYDG